MLKLQTFQKLSLTSLYGYFNCSKLIFLEYNKRLIFHKKSEAFYSGNTRASHRHDTEPGIFLLFDIFKYASVHMKYIPDFISPLKLYISESYVSSLQLSLAVVICRYGFSYIQKKILDRCRTINIWRDKWALANSGSLKISNTEYGSKNQYID